VVTVPALIQICLLVALWFLGSYSDLYAAQSIIARAHTDDLRDLIAAEIYVLSSADLALSNNSALPAQADEKLKQVGELLARLKESARQGPARSAGDHDIVSNTAALLYEVKHQELLRFTYRHEPKVAARAGLAQSPRTEFESYADRVETLMANLEKQEAFIPSSEPLAAQKSRHMWYVLAALATVINLLSLLLVAFMFNRDLVQRILVLYENTRRFPQGQKLLPQLAGSDEIALLDRAFHKMASAIVDSVLRDAALFHSVKSVLASMDHLGRIHEVNKAVRMVLGFEPEELSGKYIQDLVPVDDRPQAVELVKMVCSGTEKPFELPVLRKDGSQVHTLWSVKYVSQEDKIFCVVQDMTERFEAENMRRQVLQMVSHDLRNPLSTIGVIYTLLETGFFIDLTTEGRDKVALCRAKIAIMLTLVNNLLDIEKIEAGMLTLDQEEVPFSVIVEDAIQQVRETIRSKRVEIYTVGSSLSVFGDRYRLAQVVINLLSNAVKRSPEGGKVRMAAVGEGSMVLVSISDQGPVIPSAAVFRAFNRFREPGNKDASEQGRSALGLAISKSIVELHGGKIGVKSSMNDTTFFFSVKPGGSH
jgi:PAS domain S-box-containing protein